MSRTIMTNLNDIGMRLSNIARVVNTLNHGEDCEQGRANSLLILSDIRARTLATSSYLSSNLFKIRGRQIQNFSLPVRLIMRAH